MIANTFIKRPVTAIVISIVLVLTGTICILNLPIDQYPEITPPDCAGKRTIYRSRCRNG